jgi:hypothetical protein
MPYRRARHAFVLSSALVAALATLPLRQAAAQGEASAPAEPVARLFDLVRGELSGDHALETVAFVEQRWRVPGNTGFDESIHRVEALLRAAGYVRQDSAPAGARLTYRVEHRPMRRDTWEPRDASLTIVGQDSALLRFATNRNMLAMYSFSTPPGGVEGEVVDVGAGRPSDFDGKDVAGKIVLGDASVGRLFAEAVQRRGALGVLAYAMPGYTKPAEHPTSIQFSGVPADTVRRAWGILLSHGARQALREALARGPVRVRVTASARQWRADELTVEA